MSYVDENEELYHYGTKRHSGRYPWGSGENPYQHTRDFIARIDELRNAGLSDTEIAKSFGLKTSQFRIQRSLALAERRAEDVEQARKLYDKLGNTSEVARRMGKNESTIRGLLKTGDDARMNQAQNTANALKKQIEEKGIIDVGTGVERSLGVSPEMLKNAMYILEREGYPVYKSRVKQLTNPGQYTTQKVLCAPGTEYKDIYAEGAIKTIDNYTSYDGGKTFKQTFAYPASMDSKRLQIRYAEDGGIKKDGVVELRRGVEDLSLGNSHYAQVRILVDGTHYIKGMAVYSDNMPDGVDVVFNTNKTKDKSKLEVLKKIHEENPDNPFGSNIKERGQSYYIGKDGKEHLSLINKTREEGDWQDWQDKLPSQFLAKQPEPLIKKQLALSIETKREEFEEIKSINNPVVKRQLLKDFADDCDSNAVHLKAAALPRQKYKVILPLNTIKDDEVYAPTFENGEKVALVRFPHGGLFEIPILTVNNKNREGRSVIGTDPIDAVGINSKVAERLSGADFDGDTVLIIPTAGNGKNRNISIKNQPPLKGLEGFDPKTKYPEIPGMKIMSHRLTQTEMGKISNLITDMTLKGADDDELARAVRHSMVVIDAEKHHLNYKQSEKDNGIIELKKKYQGHYDLKGNWKESGASTLLSRAKNEEDIDPRYGTTHINQKGKKWYDPTKPEGALLYNSREETYVNKEGKTIRRTQKSTQMAEVDDPHKLSSGYYKEELYADYAADLKAMANEARKEMVYTPRLTYDPEANKKYKAEVDHLNAQYDLALRNAPKEREAQRIASNYMKAIEESNPDMDGEERRKFAQRSLTRARLQVGAERHSIKINDREWEAIQAGAISDTKLEKMFTYTDGEDLRKRATPKTMTILNDAKISKMNAMRNSGYSIVDIAKSIGVSTSTVSRYIDPRAKE